ncbi:hypothetical protein B0H17DRAFT_937647, partial [Mycena rosella]
PFASKAEWELASFLARSSMTMKDVNDFLALQMVHLSILQFYNCLPISFKSAKELRARIEILPSGPQWQSQIITYDGFPTKSSIVLYYRDPLQCLPFLLQNLLVKAHLELIPKKNFRNGKHFFGEWITGDGAWEIQVIFLPRKRNYHWLKMV